MGFRKYVGRTVRELREFMAEQGFTEFDYSYYNYLLFGNKTLNLSLKVLCNKIPLINEDSYDDHKIIAIKPVYYFEPDYKAMENREASALFSFLLLQDTQLEIVENRRLSKKDILNGRYERLNEFRTKLDSTYEAVIEDYFHKKYKYS